MFTEEQLLKLLKVQSNLSPADFEKIFGDRGEHLFRIFSRESWNLISFLFNKVNGEDREKLLEYVNSLIQLKLWQKYTCNRALIKVEDIPLVYFQF